MSKRQWVLIDRWMVEGGQRIVVKPKESGHLIDVMLAEEGADQIIQEIIGKEWTKEELIEYLDRHTGK